MKKIFQLAIMACTALSVHATDYTRGLSIWFDTPNTLVNKAVWFGNTPAMWKGENKPESAGDTATNPDAGWESQSLPIGNGSLGANIMGSVEAERITFNEKTLWRGGPNTSAGAAAYWNVNKQSAHILDEIRQAFINGDEKRAMLLTQKNFNSEVPYESWKEKPFRFGNFTTMGEFYIETGLSTIGMSDYKRILSLDSALAIVQFNKDGVAYERNYFISYPNNVMTIRFKANKPGKQNLVFSYEPNPVSTGKMETDGNNGLVYTARLDNNQMEYVIRIHATAKGGTLSNQSGKLSVNGADEVIFLVTADTDYQINFNPDFNDPKAYVGVNPSETTATWMKDAAALGYDALFDAHYKDYASLFNRVSLSLNGSGKTDNIPTPQRLKNYRKGKPDFYLEELYYQFGRYLLIASSRPGNLPANLQGIWHNNVDGPWRVDYHNNINVQMNYWPAGSTNLAECTLPLIDFIKTLVKPGEKTAQAYFGARGWTASISGNIFGFTAPLESENMSWNFNPMAGPWLATHVWDYYDYTRDCTQLVSSVNNRNFSGKFCKIQRFFHRCIPAARYIDFQVSKEVRITGCTVRDSASLVLLLAFASDWSCICTGCNDDIFRLIGIFFACQDFDVSAQFCICDRITDMFCAELFCLFIHSAYKRNSRLSFYDLSRIVFYFVCVDNLAAGLSFFDDQGVQSASACI